MNKIFTAFFAVLMLCPAVVSARNEVIYGDDNRIDYSKVPAPFQKLADSVVSLWDRKSIKEANGQQYLVTESFARKKRLCPGETFEEQPVGAFCSGTLVGEDLVLTAGHCIKDEASCATSRFVFGYNDKNLKNGMAVNDDFMYIKTFGLDASKMIPLEKGMSAKYIVTAYPVDSKNIYSCSKIVKRHLGNEPEGTMEEIWNFILDNLNIVEPDYALIKLDRKVTDRNPLPVERTAKLNEGEKIFTIGHPTGLPVKITGGATIRNNSPENFYLSDLDGFAGNSGSAVFSNKTGRIIGILVRGAMDDFVKDSDKNCYKQNRVSQFLYGNNKGISINRIEPLLSIIPEIGGNKSAGAKKTSHSSSEVKAKSPDLNTMKKPNVKITNPF